MQIERLILTDFRNYHQQEIVLSPGFNLLYGDNAQGKTNALEAVHFLALGRSHRAGKDAECIRWGADTARIRGEVCVRERKLDLAVELVRHGQRVLKRVLANGIAQAKLTAFIGRFQVVLFAPEDLQLVKGTPAIRRRFLDTELVQSQPQYLHHLASYQRALQQRNAVLKHEKPDWDLLHALDAQLAQHGAQVLFRRLRYVRELNELTAYVYARIAGPQDKVEVQYRSTLEQIHHQPTVTLEQLEAYLAEAMAQQRRQDEWLHHTTIGPHRDDLTLTVDGRPAALFASQGQQRTMALSLRLAEMEWVARACGEYPVLLLDDVFSELDDQRQRGLVWSMTEKTQVILTATRDDNIFPPQRGPVRVFQVCSGIIQKKG
ncbi:MAG: DNA replication/repair protein RecF [Alicyclobacillus sp.]|nr:DNA replication/repair protein RecF [Alicyclobacillus sp.]